MINGIEKFKDLRTDIFSGLYIIKKMLNNTGNTARSLLVPNSLAEHKTKYKTAITKTTNNILSNLLYINLIYLIILHNIAIQREKTFHYSYINIWSFICKWKPNRKRKKLCKSRF